MSEKEHIRLWNTRHSQMHPDTTPWNNGGKMAVEFLNKDNGLVPLDWEKIEQAFYKECCQTFTGNSGIGGDYPQEPDVQLSCYPQDVIDFMKSKFSQQKAVEYVPSEEEIQDVILKVTGDKPKGLKTTMEYAIAIHSMLLKKGNPNA